MKKYSEKFLNIPAKIVGVLLLVLGHGLLFAQDSNKFTFSLGQSVYNEFFSGSQFTRNMYAAMQGFKFNPSFRIGYEVNRNYSFDVKYEHGLYYNYSFSPERPFLESIRQSFQLSAKRRIRDKSYIGLGFTFINHKFWKIFGNTDMFSHIGPSIAYGVHLPNNYELAIGYDIIWDFDQGEFFFFSEFANLRFYKNFSANQKKYARETNDLSLNFGFESAYNFTRKHFEYMPWLQKMLFAEVEIKPLEKWSWVLFVKRSIWLDVSILEGTSFSQYIITNNAGVKYSTRNLKHRFGLSHFMSNESAYRKMRFIEDSVITDRIFDFHGLSLSYERHLRHGIFLSTQVDFIMDAPIFEATYERIRPRLGLKYML